MMLSEVESMDTLPFERDSTPLTQVPQNEKLLAPSIDEVDENPESLRMLRGQGRYFGATDDDEGGGILEAEPKCMNCSQRGHLKKKCPHVICTYCGSMDDHYSQHCTKAIKCSNCNEFGHYRSQCPKKWKKMFCTLCNSKNHSRERCPSIWRVYVVKEDTQKQSLPMHALYCYNCGSKGHFGDDCPKRRSSRVPNEDGSSFSGDNLSQPLKINYFQNLRKQKQEQSSSADYMTYEEFDRAMYDDEPRKNKKSQKRNRERSSSHLDYGGDDNSNSYESRNYSNNNNRSNSSRKRSRNSNYHPPPYQNHDNSQGQNGRRKDFKPVQTGGIFPPSRNRTHPLDFPRSNSYQNSSYVSQGMATSRYNRGAPSEMDTHNYKSYNSFRPSRSGTLKR